MHAEPHRFRGNGFIISDGGFPPEKPFRKQQTVIYHNTTDIKRLSNALSQPLRNASEYASEIFDEYTTVASQNNRRFLKSTLAFSSAVLSVCIFFRFFTIAEAIYVDKKFLGTASSEECISQALSSAHTYAETLGIKQTVPKITTSPIITLKRKLNSPLSLKNKLLLCSEELSEAYTLISDGKAIYNAATYDDAKIVLDEHIKSMFSIVYTVIDRLIVMYGWDDVDDYFECGSFS